MKNSHIAILAFAAIAVLGCDSHTPLTERTKEVFDMGSVPLPGESGKAGYSLHGYRLLNGASQDHFTYILEKNGQPFAGTSTNYDYKSGKSTKTDSISSVIAPSAVAAIDTCSSEAECSTKIAALQTRSGELSELQAKYQALQQQ